MNLGDWLNQLLGKPVSPLPDQKSKVAELLDQIFRQPAKTAETKVKAQETPSPAPSPTTKSAVLGDQTQLPDKFPVSKDVYINAVKEGFANWFHDREVPATKYAETMYNESVKYSIFNKYPFLLPAIMMNEMRGGIDNQEIMQKNPDAANNPHTKYNYTNFGIRINPNDWTPSSVDDVIYQTARALGNDPTSHSAKAYGAWHASHNLKDLGNIYAPPSDNGGANGTGGDKWGSNIQSEMDVFDEKAGIQKGGQ
jgi:hypothetical protein